MLDLVASRLGLRARGYRASVCAPGGRQDPVRLGIVSRTATYWPLYLMSDIELVELGGTAAGIDALLRNEVDVAATCPDALIASGADVRVGAGLVDRPPTSVVAGPGIACIEDLRGRRIATTSAQGSVSLFLRAFLRGQGLERGDYAEVVVGPTPAQAAALQRAKVDAAMLTEPFDERLGRQGFRILADVGDALGPCAFTTLNVRRGWTATQEWVVFRDRLAAATARLVDPDSRRRELPALTAGTAGTVIDVPRVRFDAVIDPASLERLIGLMRADGTTVRLDATTCLDRAVPRKV